MALEQRLRDYTRVQYLKAVGHSQRQLADVLSLHRTPLLQGDPFSRTTSRLPTQSIRPLSPIVSKTLVGRMPSGTPFVARNSGAKLRGSIQTGGEVDPNSASKTSALPSKQRTFLIRQFEPVEEVYKLMQRFIQLVRHQQVNALDTWLADCSASTLLACQHFAEGLRQDYLAVRAALHLPWSNERIAYCTSFAL